MRSDFCLCSVDTSPNNIQHRRYISKFFLESMDGNACSNVTKTLLATKRMPAGRRQNVYSIEPSNVQRLSKPRTRSSIHSKLISSKRMLLNSMKTHFGQVACCEEELEHSCSINDSKPHPTANSVLSTTLAEEYFDFLERERMGIEQLDLFSRLLPDYLKVWCMRVSPC